MRSRRCCASAALSRRLRVPLSSALACRRQETASVLCQGLRGADCMQPAGGAAQQEKFPFRGILHGKVCKVVNSRQQWHHVSFTPGFVQ